MIHVDVENEIFDLDGSLNEVLAEVSTVVSIYKKQLVESYDGKKAKAEKAIDARVMSAIQYALAIYDQADEEDEEDFDTDEIEKFVEELLEKRHGKN